MISAPRILLHIKLLPRFYIWEFFHNDIEGTHQVHTDGLKVENIIIIILDLISTSMDSLSDQGVVSNSLSDGFLLDYFIDCILIIQWDH